jgi:xylulokinase
MNVTLVTEAVRELFAWGHEQFEQAVRSVPAGSDGLLLLPYLAGERTPNLPGGSGVLHGLTTANFTAAHLARAAIEGVTLGLAYGLRRLRELGIQPTEIRVTGGGSNSRTWRQLCADIFGVPVVSLVSAEGAGLGAALQAAWLVAREQGDARMIAEFVSGFVSCDEATRVAPDSASAAIHREQTARADRLREALTANRLL